MPNELRRPVKIVHGKIVRPFDWKAHQTFAPFAQLAGAVARLDEGLDSSISKARQIAMSQDLTVSGKAAAKRQHAAEHAAPVIKQAIEARKAAEAEIAKTRPSMRLDIDKSDIAGALRRQEIRAWLRGLDDDQRNMVLAGPGELAFGADGALTEGSSDIDPDIAAAIIELPPQLAGVTATQHERLRDRVLAARFPEHAARLATLGDAIESLDDHIAMATAVLTSELGVPDLNEMAGLVPSLAEKLAERLADLPDKPDDDSGERAA